MPVQVLQLVCSIVSGGISNGTVLLQILEETVHVP